MRVFALCLLFGAGVDALEAWAVSMGGSCTVVYWKLSSAEIVAAPTLRVAAASSSPADASGAWVNVAANTLRYTLDPGGVATIWMQVKTLATPAVPLNRRAPNVPQTPVRLTPRPSPMRRLAASPPWGSPPQRPTVSSTPPSVPHPQRAARRS